MVKGFDVVKNPQDVSFYAGLLLSSYAICQAITIMYWGPLSDRIGRRPTLLMGLTGDLATFVLFGLSKSYKWAIITRSLNGLFAGNSAVVKSVVAEISDDSNRPRMMALLPLMWNIGAVAGSAIGGLLADPVSQYPSIFGRCELFRTFPYLLPCLVGSLTTTFGLVVGLFKLKETLVIEPAVPDVVIQETDIATETTHLVSTAPQQHGEPLPAQSMLSLLTPTSKFVMATNVLMCLAIAMGDQIYPIFAASAPADGGLGFSTRDIGISLSVSSVAVLYLQLVAYPKLAHKYGALTCCQMGLKIMTPFFFAMPFLSLLSSSIENMIAGKTFMRLPMPTDWMSFVGFEYCMLWILLIGLLLVRITGNVLAFTSLNLLVSNIAPSKAMLGTMNSMQQLGTTGMWIAGPLISGTLWSWSIKHSLPFPFNSHLVWVLCSCCMAISWRISLKLPSSVNVFASGQTRG
ncbi:hypothetical protein GGF47_000240 [Coemansia sp. RSA 2524]|nr:hypothetical protein GGF47_000240 [Coemansia sp. RSA 2524]